MTSHGTTMFALPRSTIAPGRFGEQRRRCLGRVRSRGSHLVDEASQGRAMLTTGVPFVRTPGYCNFGIHVSVASLGIGESGLEFHLEGARRCSAQASRQNVGGYLT